MKKAIILIPFILWIGGFCLFAYKINRLNADTSKNTDAIIVLTGGRNRIHEATNLFNENKAKYLFISGVAKDITLDNIQNTQNIKIKNVQNVDIGYNAANTVENADETTAWIKIF